MNQQASNIVRILKECSSKDEQASMKDKIKIFLCLKQESQTYHTILTLAKKSLDDLRENKFTPNCKELVRQFANLDERMIGKKKQSIKLDQPKEIKKPLNNKYIVLPSGVTGEDLRNNYLQLSNIEI